MKDRISFERKLQMSTEKNFLNPSSIQLVFQWILNYFVKNKITSQVENVSDVSFKNNMKSERW